MITAAIKQMIGSLAFFVFTFAKEEGCAVGESVVELLEGVGGVHGAVSIGAVGVVPIDGLSMAPDAGQGQWLV